MTKLKKKILSIVGIISVLGIISIAGLAAGCMSATALSIDISLPQLGATVSESPVTVMGTASGYPRGEVVFGEQTARIVPEVMVNGIKAEVAADGSFSVQVELTEGENTIEAIALLNDVEARNSITVTYTPVAPALSVGITSPEDGTELNESPVALIGTVSDAEAIVTVNDQAVEVAADGSFSAQVELIEGENTIEVVATLGDQEARDSITVTFTPEVALSIEITSPQDGAELIESPVPIIGIVSNAEAMITVNGVVVADNSTFSAQVVLTEGQNTITAAATLGELQAEDSITVTFTPPTPALWVKITSPQDGAELIESLVAVTGTVSDVEAIVTINGQAVEVDAVGTFSTQVELTEGENVITTATTLGELQAEDSITVTFTPPAPALWDAIEEQEQAEMERIRQEQKQAEGQADCSEDSR